MEHCDGSTPSVDRFLLDAMTKEIRRLSALLSDALSVPVDKRVLRRVLEVVRIYGAQRPGATVSLIQEDPAGLFDRPVEVFEVLSLARPALRGPTKRPQMRRRRRGITHDAETSP